eukprot:g13707.t1
MVASEQDKDSDVDEAWDTREEPASEHSNSAGENSDASSTNASNNERSLALPSNEVEERDLFSMAAEEGLDVKKTKEYDESELKDAAVKIQKVHRGRKARKLSKQAKRTKQEKHRSKKDMEAQEAKEMRNKHIKYSPKKNVKGKKKSFVYAFSYESITGNLRPFPDFDVSVLRKKYDTIEKLFRDYPEPSLSHGNKILMDKSKRSLNIHITSSSLLSGKRTKIMRYLGQLTIYLPLKIVGNRFSPSCPFGVIHCLPEKKIGKDTPEYLLVINCDSIIREAKSEDSNKLCFEIGRRDNSGHLVNKKGNKLILPDDRIPIDEKGKRSNRKFVETMFLSASDESDFEDWMLDLENCVGLCKGIEKWRKIEQESKIKKKENSDSEYDEEACEVENSPADFEKTYVDPLAQNNNVGEREEDRPEMENGTANFIQTSKDSELKDTSTIYHDVSRSQNEARQKRLKNMQIVTNKEDMTAEEMEEFWAARSLDPYKEHRRKLADIKEQFYAAELDSTKLIEDIKQANSKETKPAVHKLSVPAKQFNRFNEILVTAERANGTAISSQALKYLSKTLRKSDSSFTDRSKTLDPKFDMSVHSSETITTSIGSQLYSAASTATSTDFRPNIHRTRSEWDNKLDYFKNRVEGLCAEAEIFVIESKPFLEINVLNRKDKLEVEQKLKVSGRPLKINFDMIKKELYAECDYWFEEIGRPMHPVRLAQHSRILVNKNSIYDDLLDFNDTLRLAEKKALPYVNELEMILEKSSNQLKSNVKKEVAKNPSIDTRVETETIETLTRRIIEGENILRKKRTEELKRMLNKKFGKIWPPSKTIIFPNNKLPNEGVILYDDYIQHGVSSTKYKDVYEVAKALSEILDQGKSEGSNILVAKNSVKSLEKLLKEALINRNINPKAFETCVAFNDYVTGRVKNIKKTLQSIEALLHRKEKSRTKVLRSLFEKFHPKDHHGITIKCIFNHLFKNNRDHHAKMLSLINSHTKMAKATHQGRER